MSLQGRDRHRYRSQVVEVSRYQKVATSISSIRPRKCHHRPHHHPNSLMNTTVSPTSPLDTSTAYDQRSLQPRFARKIPIQEASKRARHHTGRPDVTWTIENSGPVHRSHPIHLGQDELPTSLSQQYQIVKRWIMPVPVDDGPTSITSPSGAGMDDPERTLRPFTSKALSFSLNTAQRDFSSLVQTVSELDIAQLRTLLLQSRGIIAGLKEELHTASSASATSTTTLLPSSRKPNSLTSNTHSNPKSHTYTQNSIPSSQHAYDLKSLAETPTPTRTGFDDVGGAESGFYSLNDEVGNGVGVRRYQAGDEEQTGGNTGEDRTTRSGTPIPSLNVDSGVGPAVHLPPNPSTSTASPTSPSTTATATVYPSNLSGLSQKRDEDAIETLEQEKGVSSKKKRPASILGLKRIPSSIVQTTAALHSVGSGVGAGGIGGGGGRNFSAGASTSSTSQNPNPNLSPNPNATSASGSTTPNSTSTSRPPSPGLTLAIPSMLSTKTRRVSSGLTTPSGRMIEELQIEVVNQKSSGDRAREELRLSQRVIGQVSFRSSFYVFE